MRRRVSVKRTVKWEEPSHFHVFILFGSGYIIRLNQLRRLGMPMRSHLQTSRDANENSKHELIAKYLHLFNDLSANGSDISIP